MPRKILKKILPDYNKIKEQKYLKIFGAALYKREIWSLRRKYILRAVFLGIFVSCLPMPLQMILLAFLAIVFNANFPIAFILLWINNPLTIPFIFYAEYKIGAFLLNAKDNIEFNFDSMYENLGDIAVYLYTGSLVLGLVLAVICTILTNILWIWYIRKQRKE